MPGSRTATSLAALCALVLAFAPGAAPAQDTSPTATAPAAAPPATATTPPAAATTPAQTTTTTTTTEIVGAAPGGSSSGDDGPSPLLVGLIALIALAALAALAWGLLRLTAWEPLWLPRLRHAVGEAGYRAGGTWAQFRDWLSPGRR